MTQGPRGSRPCPACCWFPRRCRVPWATHQYRTLGRTSADKIRDGPRGLFGTTGPAPRRHFNGRRGTAALTRAEPRSRPTASSKSRLLLGRSVASGPYELLCAHPPKCCAGLRTAAALASIRLVDFVQSLADGPTTAWTMAWTMEPMTAHFRRGLPSTPSTGRSSTVSPRGSRQGCDRPATL